MHSGRSEWGAALYPCCAGHEVLAEVIAVGSSVTRFKIGDKVLWGPFRDSCGDCEYCSKRFTHVCQKVDENERFLYGVYFGGYSTHIQQPESHCFKCPENVNLETIAPIMCAGVTTFSPLDMYGEKGMKVAILGVGGLGHLAAQFASQMGMEVTALTASDGKEEFFKTLGITKNINWKKEKLSNHRNAFDLIINTLPVMINEKEVEELLDCLRPYGKFINVGLSDVKDKLIVKQFSLTAKCVSIVGSVVGGVEQTQRTLDFVGKHKVECLCEFFSFEDFPKALERLEHGRPHFRCVVRTGEFSKNFPQKK